MKRWTSIDYLLSVLLVGVDLCNVLIHPDTNAPPCGSTFAGSTSMILITMVILPMELELMGFIVAHQRDTWFWLWLNCSMFLCALMHRT